MNNDYLQYTPEELALDPAFIAWIRERDASDGVWETWLEAHPEKVSDVEQARKLVGSLRFKTEPVTTDRDALWSRISESTEVVKPLKRNRLQWVYWAAAAAGVAVLLYAGFGYRSGTLISAPVAQTLDYALPDGSKVLLNADSKLQVNEKNWKDQRLVQLEGEAYFDVEKGDAFSVELERATVVVLGTEFNIYSRPDSFSVTCTEGSVGVDVGGQARVALTPGEQYYLTSQGIWRKSTSSQSIEWRNGRFVYRNQTVGKVLDEISRQFDVNITGAEAYRDSIFTGVFTTTDLDEALKSVLFTQNLEYRTNGKTIEVISRRGN